MNTFIQKFFMSKKMMFKRSLTVALLGVLVLGSVFLTGGSILSTPVAHACSLSVNISVSGSVNNTTPHVGDIVVYTFSTNTFGGADVPTSTPFTIVMATDTLPSGLTFDSSSTSGGPYSGTWSGGTVTFTITATVNATGTIQYTPTFGYSDEGACADSMTVSLLSPVTITAIPPSAPLAITKAANPTSVVAGSTTTVDYTITVTNNSTTTTSTDVVVSDPLPSGLIFESSTAPSAYNATSGVWTVGNLVAGASSTLSIYAEAAQDASSTITNIATVSAGTTDSNSSTTAQATISVTQPTSTPSADLSISKTVSPSSTTMENVSSTVDYTITVTNNSTTTTSTDVVATDTLPTELTFENATASASTSYASSTGTWTIGTLAPSSTATLNIAAMVNSNASSTLWNTATVSASTTDLNTANNSSSVSIDVQRPTSTTPSADLSINKTVDNNNPSAGDTVNYTIAVTNESTSTTSTDVVASDTLPTDLTFENATASASTSYATSTGIWTIGTLAPSSTATLKIAALVNSGDAGDIITNTATVSASTTDQNPSNNSSTVSITCRAAADARVAVAQRMPTSRSAKLLT